MLTNIDDRHTPVNASRFDTAVDDVFGRIASRYDLLSDLFSLWIHRLWKRRVAALIAAEPWTRLLDAASGTGDIVLRVLSHQTAGASRKNASNTRLYAIPNPPKTLKPNRHPRCSAITAPIPPSAAPA